MNFGQIRTALNRVLGDGPAARMAAWELATAWLYASDERQEAFETELMLDLKEVLNVTFQQWLKQRDPSGDIGWPGTDQMREAWNAALEAAAQELKGPSRDAVLALRD